MFLILVAFDRYCLTSREYDDQKFSSPRTEVRLVVITTLV